MLFVKIGFNDLEYDKFNMSNFEEFIDDRTYIFVKSALIKGLVWCLIFILFDWRWKWNFRDSTTRKLTYQLCRCNKNLSTAKKKRDIFYTSYFVLFQINDEYLSNKNLWINEYRILTQKKISTYLHQSLPIGLKIWKIN